MDPETAQLVAKVGVTAAVCGMLALLGKVLGDGGGRGQATEGVRELGYLAYVRSVAVLCGIMAPLGLLAAIWVSPPADERNYWLLVGIAVAFLAVGGWLALEGFGTRVLLTREGLTKFHWWYRPRFVAWGDVERIDSRRYTRSDYAVRTRAGVSLGVPLAEYFGPGEWFAEACQHNLRPEQYRAAFESPKS